MRSAWKFGLGGLLAMSALAALFFFLTSSFNWNLARPWISEHIEAQTGRRFTFEGDLRVAWRRAPPGATGWRALLPWPRVQANDIALANPAWARSGADMLRIRRLEFDLSPLPLLQKEFHVAAISMGEPEIVLEHDAEGRNNWALQSNKQSAGSFDLAGLSIENGKLRIVDPAQRTDLALRMATRTTAGEEDGILAWEVSGSLAGERISGGGTAGAPRALARQGAPYPVAGELRLGKAALTAKGHLTDPKRLGLAGFDFDLKIVDASTAQLTALTGVALPPAIRFHATGRLIRALDREGTQVRFENFSGKIGGSDIAGTLVYSERKEDGQEKRPLLHGELASRHFEMKDIAAFFGDAAHEAARRQAARASRRAGKVLPAGQYAVGKWNRFDAQVKISVRKLIRQPRLPLDAFVTDLRLERGRLSLAPLQFGMAGGTLKGHLLLDTNSSPPQADLSIAARQMKLKSLFPRMASMRSSVGEVNGDARLIGRGDSVATLLGTANGQVRALISEGSLSKYALESMGLNVGAMVATKLFGDSQVQLHCMAAHFRVEQGVMKTDAFVLDTQDAIVKVAGEIDLVKESLALDIFPESKGLRLFSLQSPLRAQGTLGKPEVVVDKKMMALRAGAAVALGAMAAPLAALAPLVSVGPEQDGQCAELLAKAKAPPAAAGAAVK